MSRAYVTFTPYLWKSSASTPYSVSSVFSGRRFLLPRVFAVIDVIAQVALLRQHRSARPDGQCFVLRREAGTSARGSDCRAELELVDEAQASEPRLVGQEPRNRCAIVVVISLIGAEE